ncbi:MAG: DUF4350 domain-containing protein [Actinomycetota bacterium]
MSIAERVRPSRGLVVGVCVAAALLLAALAGGRPGRDGPPLDPRSDAPLGTSALVELVRRLGGRVDLTAGLPVAADDVALVLQDRLDPDQTADLERWVRDGGTLVVTDPSSPLTPLFDDIGLRPAARPTEVGTCSITALSGMGPVDGGEAVRYAVPPGADSCYGDGDSAFVVAQELGAGEIVAVGGAALLTNALLGEHDNAVLAAALLVPSAGTEVRFVDAPLPAGGGEKTLVDLVPAGVKRALAQLAFAFVLYALWRAIRHGRPVLERQPVEVSGSELVVAVGRLLSRTRSPQAAAERLRGSLRRSLRTRLGVAPDASIETLAEITAARTGQSISRVLEALDEREITSDAQLVAVAAAVASIREEVLR